MNILIVCMLLLCSCKENQQPKVEPPVVMDYSKDSIGNCFANPIGISSRYTWIPCELAFPTNREENL